MNVFHIRFLCHGMRRRTDRNNHNIRIRDAFFHRRGKRDLSRFQIFMEQFFQSVFKQRDFSRFQRVDFGLDRINAHNVVPQFGKTDARRQTDIARPDNSDFHRSSLTKNKRHLMPSIYTLFHIGGTDNFIPAPYHL